MLNLKIQVNISSNWNLVAFFGLTKKKNVHKFKPCSIQIKRLNRKNSKKTLFKVIQVDNPTDYLPSFLNDFEILDSQGPAEKPKKDVILRPKLLNNIFNEQVLGKQTTFVAEI